MPVAGANLARFDEHWRVVLEGDDRLSVWELRNRSSRSK
jgi:hypothetical protein